MNDILVTISKWINTPFVHIGKSPVTVSGLVIACLIIMVTLVISRIIRRTLQSSLKRRNLSTGVSYALTRFLHYAIIVLGVLIAAQTIGLNLGSLAVVFGFLSVGIGFGMKNVTSNFISGLILLIERPVSVGDFVEVGGETGRVTHIKMRATTVLTRDNVTIVVPNSKFIEENVTNWSLDDPKVRIHCPVGVAYGSDVERVKEALISVAREHPDVLDDPEPEVRFMDFGDSSLNFDLLVWIDKAHERRVVRSQINFMIDAAFRRSDITIPFPQRDIHIRSTAAVKQGAEIGG